MVQKVEECGICQLNPGNGVLCELCDYQRGDQCEMVHPMLRRTEDGNEECSHFHFKVHHEPMEFGLMGSKNDFALLEQELKVIDFIRLNWRGIPNRVGKNRHYGKMEVTTCAIATCMHSKGEGILILEHSASRLEGGQYDKQVATECYIVRWPARQTGGILYCFQNGRTLWLQLRKGV